MGTVPTNPKLRMEWYESHVAQIALNAVAVGTTTTATTDLSTKTLAARTKYNAKLEAENAAKVATSEWHSAIEAMATAGSAIIDQIRAKARTVGGNSIYELAGIPAPATPTPVPPPGQPTDLKVALDATGALTLKWKCVNPPGASGTTYNVFRRIGAVGEFSFLGGSGVREITDASVPAGAALVMYKIQGVRSTSVGPWNTFNVFFGVDTGGAAMVTSVAVAAAAPKMAA